MLATSTPKLSKAKNASAATIIAKIGSSRKAGSGSIGPRMLDTKPRNTSMNQIHPAEASNRRVAQEAARALANLVAREIGLSSFKLSMRFKAV